MNKNTLSKIATHVATQTTTPFPVEKGVALLEALAKVNERKKKLRKKVKRLKRTVKAMADHTSLKEEARLRVVKHYIKLLERLEKLEIQKSHAEDTITDVRIDRNKWRMEAIDLRNELKASRDSGSALEREPEMTPFEHAVDNALLINCLGAVTGRETEAEARDKLDQLIKYEITLATDPAIGGDRVMKPTPQESPHNPFNPYGGDVTPERWSKFIKDAQENTKQLLEEDEAPSMSMIGLKKHHPESETNWPELVPNAQEEPKPPYVGGEETNPRYSEPTPQDIVVKNEEKQG